MSEASGSGRMPSFQRTPSSRQPAGGMTNRSNISQAQPSPSPSVASGQSRRSSQAPASQRSRPPPSERSGRSTERAAAAPESNRFQVTTDWSTTKNPRQRFIGGAGSAHDNYQTIKTIGTRNDDVDKRVKLTEPLMYEQRNDSDQISTYIPPKETKLYHPPPRFSSQAQSFYFDTPDPKPKTDGRFAVIPDPILGTLKYFPLYQSDVRLGGSLKNDFEFTPEPSHSESLKKDKKSFNLRSSSIVNHIDCGIRTNMKIF